jgi:hypothetical protein
MPSPGRPLADLAPRQPQYSDGFRISKAKKTGRCATELVRFPGEAFHIAGIGGILVGCSFSSIMLRPSASLMVWFSVMMCSFFTEFGSFIERLSGIVLEFLGCSIANSYHTKVQWYDPVVQRGWGLRYTQWYPHK